jgi:broad specificity phosphatase PhoE
MRLRVIRAMPIVATLLLAAVAVSFPVTADAAPGTIVLVRHAEREQAPMTEDPPLTAAGKARAGRLATLLGRADVKAIYVTRFQRSRDTAAPLATALKVEPIVESETQALVAKLKANDAARVLVVGHSDTVPDVIRAFGGPAVTIADDRFDDVFVLTPASGALLRLTY